MNDGFAIIIDEVRQPLIYFVLPKNISDYLIVNTPEFVMERIDKWINNGKDDLYLDATNRKYTFRDALVYNQVIQKNRYGIPSRDLKISFDVMLNGFQTRGK